MATRNTQSDTQASGLESSQNDVNQAVAALAQATQALVRATTQLVQAAQQLADLSSARPAPGGTPVPALQINTLEDDLFSDAVATANPSNAPPVPVEVPANPNPKLQLTVVEARPAPGRYNPGTANFRYWAASEALIRGINFWGALLPQAQHGQPPTRCG
jgi:hypothetical protein